MNTIDSNETLRIENANTMMVLGILSIVFSGLIGIILGAIGLTMAEKSQKRIADNQTEFLASDVKNLNIGRTCSIIGICTSLLIMIILAFFIFTK